MQRASRNNCVKRRAAERSSRKTTREPTLSRHSNVWVYMNTHVRASCKGCRCRWLPLGLVVFKNMLFESHVIGNRKSPTPALCTSGYTLAGGHNKAYYCSGSHLKESSFRSIDLSLALALSMRRDLRRIVARVWGVLGAPPPYSSTVASCG